MMNPAFSTAHMRDLTPTFYAVTQKVFVLNFNALVESDGYP